MNKLLLFSRIKGLIFVLKSSTEYNIDFIYCKLSFWYRIKIYVLMVLRLLDLTFFAAKKVSFPQSRKFALTKQFFHNTGMFPQSRTFSTIKEYFHSQGILPQSRNFPTTKEIFHKKISTSKDVLHENFFP